MDHFKYCPICGFGFEKGRYSGIASRYWERCGAGCYELELAGFDRKIETFYLWDRRVVFLGQFLDASPTGPGYQGSIHIQTSPGIWRSVGKVYSRRPAVEEIRQMIRDTIASTMMVMI